MPEAPVRQAGTILAFDFGVKRIGVAVGSAFGHGARALAVVDVHAHGPDWNEIDRLRREWRPDGFVVGDPMTLDGGDQPIRKFARAFAGELRSRYALPVVMVDERASSIAPRRLDSMRTATSAWSAPASASSGSKTSSRRHAAPSR